MINYFNQILDQYDEKQVNEKIASLPDAPVNDSDYALVLIKGDQKIKKFPINTGLNAALSFQAYEKNASKLNKEMKKIASTNLAISLDLFDIKHNLAQYNDVKSNTYTIKKQDEIGIKKQADFKQHFALGDKLPIDTPADLNESVIIFLKEAKKLPHKEKKECAYKLVKRASDLGMQSLPSAIYEYCSTTPASLQQMKGAMFSRTMNYPQEAKLLVKQMFDNIKTAEDVDSLINVINDLDKKLNMIPDKHPDLSSKFYTTEKTASQLFEDKLKNALDNNLLNDYLDSEIISSLEDGSISYNSLNSRTKKLIETVINYV